MHTSRFILVLCLGIFAHFSACALQAASLEQERARNEEEALAIWPEVADAHSVMAKEVIRLLDYYSERQDPRLSTVNAPMWIASQAAANTESARTDAESQQSAMRLYPQLAVLDSPINRLFRETYVRYKQVDPKYFEDPRWPIKLARQCAVQLEAGNAAGRTEPELQTAPPVSTPAEAPSSAIRPWVMASVLIIASAALGYAIFQHARRMHRINPDGRDGWSI